MIKAIFFDVDGTLISKSRSVLSEGVIAALKQLQEKGIKLFIASGRHYLELYFLYKFLFFLPKMY